MKKVILFLLVSIIFLYLCAPLHAKTRKIMKWDYSTLYNTTVRLIRVDMNWEIVDKDKDAGFIIFKYSSKSKKFLRASIEFIREETGENDDAGEKSLATSVIIQVSIPGVSSVEERMLIDDLNKKLHEEK